MTVGGPSIREPSIVSVGPVSSAIAEPVDQLSDGRGRVSGFDRKRPGVWPLPNATRWGDTGVERQPGSNQIRIDTGGGMKHVADLGGLVMEPGGEAGFQPFDDRAHHSSVHRLVDGGGPASTMEQTNTPYPVRRVEGELPGGLHLKVTAGQQVPKSTLARVAGFLDMHSRQVAGYRTARLGIRIARARRHHRAVLVC